MGDHDWVSGGYLVSRWVDRQDAVVAAPFPEPMLSVSEHVAPILPSMPLGWVEAANAPPGPFSSYADEVQGKILWALAADLERFGLPADRATVLAELLSVAAARGDFYSPSGFASVDTARRFLRLAGGPSERSVILGLALPAGRVDAVAALHEPGAFPAALTVHGQAPDPAGEVVGFEVLGSSDGEVRSWLESPRRDAAAAEAGVQVNGRGLLPTLRGAQCLAALLDDRAGSSSGVAWAAWRIALYSVAAEAAITDAA